MYNYRSDKCLLLLRHEDPCILPFLKACSNMTIQIDMVYFICIKKKLLTGFNPSSNKNIFLIYLFTTWYIIAIVFIDKHVKSV